MEEKNIEQKTAEKYYRYMKNGSSVEDFMQKFHMTYQEVEGLMELCRIYGKDVITTEKRDTLVFEKPIYRNIKTLKPGIDYKGLVHTEFVLISDTHIGNEGQQLHLVNDVYKEAYNRGIPLVIHCGDVTDGYYPIRANDLASQCLQGFDSQLNYVKEMWPEVNGIETMMISGNHDATYAKNALASVVYWLSQCRDDITYLGPDSAVVDLNKVKIFLDHPDGGNSKALSYKVQQRIESWESEYKPKILAVGHFHKSYSFVYRNVYGLLVPCLCNKTPFQKRQGLSNAIGAYFIDMYSDKKGNIQYFEAEEKLFKQNQLWDEAGKDKRKVKQLVIR